MKTPWSEEHTRLAAMAVPVVDATSDTEVDRVWNRIGPVVADGARPRRSRLRMVVGAGVVAAVVGVSGFAAADIFSARTGRGPVDAEDLLLGGPGEKLDPAGPDFASVIAEEATDIPFPSTEARQQTVAFWTDDLTRDDPAPGTSAVSTGALRAWMASDAVCFWANQWAVATREGDAAARRAAVAVIDAADAWPAVTDLDPTPYARWQTVEVEDRQTNEVTTTRVRDESHFFYLSRVERAAAGTDLDAMARALLGSGRGCWTQQVPDLPMADPMYAESHGWRP